MANKVGGKFQLIANKKISQKGVGKKKVKLTVNRNTKIRIRKV
jgi:hypothetical protein